MDEPTNGLDIVSKSQFRKIIAAAIGEDRCMVISTHQVKDLENLIDRVTFIDEGRIVFDESIDDISQKLLFRHAYDPADLHNALYRENAFGGDIVLLPNTDGRDSRPDLEILYKAVMLNGEKLKALFKTKG
jgi:ABC-2 type transport system ATP-binding protein